MAGKENIIIFDGQCIVCNKFARLISRVDKGKFFFFTHLQSDFSKKLDELDFDSIALVSNNKLFIKSDALIEISKHLQYPWKVFFAAKVIPKPIRNYIYDFVARNRYKWFGKKINASYRVKI